jgi:hypothetical protein
MENPRENHLFYKPGPEVIKYIQENSSGQNMLDSTLTNQVQGSAKLF